MFNAFNSELIVFQTSQIFSKTALECIQTLLGIECDIKEDWQLVPRLTAEFDNVVIMGSASQQYQAILAIGIDDTAIKEFLMKDTQKSDIFDVFGEVANNYCAMVMDNSIFRSQFGILNQSIPVLYSKGVPFLPFISGIEGKVYANKHHIYFGYALQKKTR